MLIISAFKLHVYSLHVYSPHTLFSKVMFILCMFIFNMFIICVFSVCLFVCVCVHTDSLYSFSLHVYTMHAYSLYIIICLLFSACSSRLRLRNQKMVEAEVKCPKPVTKSYLVTWMDLVLLDIHACVMIVITIDYIYFSYWLLVIRGTYYTFTRVRNTLSRDKFEYIRSCVRHRESYWKRKDTQFIWKKKW